MSVLTPALKRALGGPLGGSLALSVSGGAGWLVEDIGIVTTLRALGTALNANPTKDVVQLGDYDAVNEFFTSSVVTTTYTGSFDGSGFTIYNLSIADADTSGATALFKFIGNNNVGLPNPSGGGVVQNLNLVDASVSGSGQTGVALLAATNGGNVLNCHVAGNTITTHQGARNGGAVAYNNANGFCQLSSANVAINCIGRLTYQGGFVGLSWGPMNQCYSYSNTVNTTDTGSWNGGFAGALGNTSGTIATAVITNCIAYGNVNGPALNASQNYNGGFVGNLLDASCTDCAAFGNVTGGSYTGGFVGFMEVFAASGALPSTTRCYARGDVTGIATNTGGFVGACQGRIVKSHAYGNVNGVRDVGAFVGLLGLTDAALNLGGHIEDCSAFGYAVSAGAPYAGGFAGQVQGVGQSGDTYAVERCFALGKPTASSNAGGFAGNGQTTGTGLTNNFSNCYWDKTTSTIATRAVGNIASPNGITGLTTTQFLSGLPGGFSALVWMQDAEAGGYPRLIDLPAPPAPSVITPPSPTQIVLVNASTNPWVAPDLNSGATYSVTVEIVGPGGNGGTATSATSGRSGGGGAFVKKNAFTVTPGTSYNFSAPLGGSLAAAWFNDATTVKADFGTHGTTGVTGAGGLVANSIGDVRFAGGGGAANTGGSSGAGGGGAAGPNGAGRPGKSSGGNATNSGGGGSGAANAGGSAAGFNEATTGSTTGGGNGADAYDGSAGGLGATVAGNNGADGVMGSGAGGGYASVLAAGHGGNGSHAGGFGSGSYGSGSGGGGGSGESTGTLTGGYGGDGSYGGGGGGGGRSLLGTPGAGGRGGASFIALTYSPTA